MSADRPVLPPMSDDSGDGSRSRRDRDASSGAESRTPNDPRSGSSTDGSALGDAANRARENASRAGAKLKSALRTATGTDDADERQDTGSAPYPASGGRLARPAHTEADVERTRSLPAQRERRGRVGRSEGRTRRAHLRLVHVDPWSVMKTAFLLSIAFGIVCVVAVAIIWGVLGAAGVWDSVNTMVRDTIGNDTAKPFNVTDYVGTSRVVGFTMLVAVVDVILITAIATLGAFVYNLAATLLGGVEVTLAEDR